MIDNPQRRLPPVNAILEQPALRAVSATHSHALIVEAVRAELEVQRLRIRGGAPFDSTMEAESVAARVAEHLRNAGAPHLRRVINATGIVLHTNLGRAPIADAAARAAFEAGRGYLNLELDLGTGKRSSRQDALRDVLTRLTGAESATAVNNCAAATVITLRTLAQGKEVVVSRGQLIEIGGGFRIPEIMAVSGASLREVGTTNITRVADYERAIGPATAALMRIHTSNYRIRGHTKEVSLEELVVLGRKHGLPVIDDVGSGALLDFARFGLTGEPCVPNSIAVGADLVLFSGDKLAGGPQAGLIVGREALVQRIEKDPLMRAFRLDKMTLAALETTLRIYLHAERAIQDVPVLFMLSASRDDLRTRAERLAVQLRAVNGIAAANAIDDTAFVGGGSFPDCPLLTTVVAVSPSQMSDAELASRLRVGNPAVMARTQNGRVLFDMRTIFERDEAELLAAVSSAAGG